ncbi:hypothetical protein WBG78_13100 [Chryseolinea sp. T2]|uniref:Rieske (2Fe-2S) protein n=1 Tax=Chryseolinea sp. T2 TaxID=3129255 RepID=UPI0030787100
MEAGYMRGKQRMNATNSKQIIVKEGSGPDQQSVRHEMLSIFRSFAFVAVLFIAFASCSTDPSDDPIPTVSFPDKVLNLNLPENIGLRSKGGSKTVKDGVRGIIIYCVDVGIYHAYERNCSYRPNEACATVNIDVSTLFMTDPCCGSNFDFNTGMPSGGLAWRPLRQYRTKFNGTDLVITDEPIE